MTHAFSAFLFDYMPVLACLSVAIVLGIALVSGAGPLPPGTVMRCGGCPDDTGNLSAVRFEAWHYRLAVFIAVWAVGLAFIIPVLATFGEVNASMVCLAVVSLAAPAAGFACVFSRSVATEAD